MSLKVTGKKVRRRFRSSRNVTSAAVSAIQPLEKRVMFTTYTIAQLEALNATISPATINNCEITTMLSQVGTVVAVSGASKALTAYTFLVNDGTGSAEVYAYNTGSTGLSYTPAVGDIINITAKYAPFDGFGELEAPYVAITKVSSGNPLPLPPVATIAQLNASAGSISYTTPDLQGYPVTIQNVYISNISGGGVFTPTSTYTWTTSAKDVTLTDSTGSFLMYSSTTLGAAYSDLVGQTTPPGAFNPSIGFTLTGLDEVYTPAGGAQINFYPISIGVPIVTSLSSAGGSTTGGSTITVNGYGFTTANNVSFGSINATNVTILSDQQLTCVVPAESVGSVSVKVIGADGTSTTSAAYLYTALPVISSVSPNAVPLAGGTVTISGSNLNGPSGAAISFNGSAGIITSDTGTSITATAPAGSTGYVNVTVTTIGATSSANASSTTTTADRLYYGAPVVSSLSVTSGNDSGGTSVVISGTGLTADATVSFQTSAGAFAATTTYNSTNGTITATSPSTININTGFATDGTFDVVVTTGGGSSETGATADQFTYGVTTIADAESLPINTYNVSLDSPNLVITSILSFGGASVNGRNYGNWAFLVTDGTGSADIYGSMPKAGSPGANYTPTVGDKIVVSGEWSPYDQIPELETLTSIVPTSSGNTVPTTVPDVSVSTLNNSNLALTGYAGYLVTVQGVEISNVTETNASTTTTSFAYNNSTGTITDTTGASIQLYYNPSSYSVAATNLPGPIPTELVDITGIVQVNNLSTPNFAELIPLSIVPSALKPIVTSINPPAQGGTAGGETVTIHGYGFQDGLTEVSFGTTNLSSGSYTIVSDNLITATAPAGTGTVDITVTDSHGPSSTSSADLYTYTTTPVVLSLSPVAGPQAGGNTVVITGSNLASGDTVKFGANSSTGSVVYSNGTLTVTAPAEALGTVSVTVTAPAGGGTSASTSASTYIYSATPAITNLNASTGVDNGGTSVIITGTGFVGTPTVTFGGIAAPKVTLNSSTQITVTTPADQGAGAVPVVVTDFLGSSSPSTYTYTPTTIAAAEKLAQNTIVTLDSPNLVVSAILSKPGYYNGVAYAYYSVLVNDGTGSADLFATATNPLPEYYQGVGGQLSNNPYVPTVGDVIVATGSLAPYNQIPELSKVTAITLVTPAASNTTVTVPPPLTSYVNASNGTTYTTNIANVDFKTLPESLAGYLVQLNNVTITAVPTGVTQFGSINIQATITDASSSVGMEFYYWPSTYSSANSFFNGLDIPTGPINLVGFVSVYNSATPEFVPISEAGTLETFTLSNSAAASSGGDYPGTTDPDGFTTINRGGSLTVTITRNEPAASLADPASVQFSVIPDSASAQGAVVDYTSSAGTLNTSNGIYYGTANFASGVSTYSFTITTPTSGQLDVGDKIFTIALSNASGGTGYLPIITGGPNSIVIHDPNTDYTLSQNNFEENATVGSKGVAHTNGSTGVAVINATGGLTPDAGLTNIDIEGTSNKATYESYGVLTYNDYYNPTVGGSGQYIEGDDFYIGNSNTPLAQINGVELETTDLPATTDISGPLNVYLVTNNTVSIANGSFGALIGQPNSPLNFNTSLDAIGGLGNQLGNRYLLGTIQYNANQSTSVYTPFNLTNLDPSGLVALESALNNGTDFRIAVTPGNAAVTATIVGSTAQGFGDILQSPILRIDYSTVNTLPGWVTLSPGATATWDGHNLDVTSGNATVIHNPLTYGYLPNVYIETGATLNVSTGISGGVYFGSLNFNGGGTATVLSTTGTPTVVVIEPNSSVVTGLNMAGGTLNLTDNFLDLQGASLSAINTLVASGYANGKWTGAGITSSTAAGDPTHLTGVGDILNANSAGGTLYATFGGVATGGATDVLVRFTYLGDANLDGKVDGSDYTLIDNGFTKALTGWVNGDFNFDGHIDGSDYALIDNSFNTQGSHLAGPTAQIAAPAAPPRLTAVPPTLTTNTTTDLFSKKKVKHTLIEDLGELVTH